MANVIGGGTGRFLTDTDGDPIGVTDDRLNVNATIGLGSSTFTTYAQFDAATTATLLSDSSNGINAIIVNCKEIIIQCDFDNTGYIMVGDLNVADNRGIKMNAGDTFILTAVDSRLISLWGSADNQNLRCMIMRQDI